MRSGRLVTIELGGILGAHDYRRIARRRIATSDAAEACQVREVIDGLPTEAKQGPDQMLRATSDQESAPRKALRTLLRPVKTRFEEQNHELQKVGKIQLTELPCQKTK